MRTLDEKIETIAREMCKDLGIDPDKNIVGNIQWKQFKEIVRQDLERDALNRAKEKLWRNKI